MRNIYTFNIKSMEIYILRNIQSRGINKVIFNVICVFLILVPVYKSHFDSKCTISWEILLFLFVIEKFLRELHFRIELAL